MAQQTAPPKTLEVRRTIRASRQRVFDAWTRPEELKKWHAPGARTVAGAEVDLRVGGSYSISMVGPDGTEHNAVGTYLEVDPPKRLVYTWSWQNNPFDSLVTIDFYDRGDATEVVLRHDLPSDDARDRHEQGWLGCFAKLEALY